MNRDIKSTISIIAAIALAVGMLLTAFHSEVAGQVNSTNSKNTTAAKPSTTAGTKQGNLPNALPNITGSIPLGSTISGAISSKVKTTLRAL